jgi:paraquat-inducible protein A
MAEASSVPHYYICNECSYHIPVGEKLGQSIECQRCGHKEDRVKPRSIQLTLAFSMTALILYIPANFFPFMTIELYGRRNSSTILSGVQALFEDGSWPIALIVFLASVLIPLLKLIALFYLGLTAKNNKHARFKTKLYRVVETVGRWSMLDIFLLAVLVAIMKLGPWTRVEPEAGSVLFLLVVIFTMLASAQFDPQLLWEDENGNS